jgi:hypothetical protein
LRCTTVSVYRLSPATGATFGVPGFVASPQAPKRRVAAKAHSTLVAFIEAPIVLARSTSVEGGK